MPLVLSPKLVPYASGLLFENVIFRQMNQMVNATSLVVQWLRLCAPNAGGVGLIPGQGTRLHMPQLRVHTLQLKDPVCN